jgi:hypothetical protein
MKTPRQILLERHGSMQTRLDTIRQKAIQEVNAKPVETDARAWSLAGLMFSLRWHLAGAAALWGLTVFLNLEGSTGGLEVAAQGGASSSAQLLAALQEHRRQLLQWEEEPAANSNPAPQALPPRRSELQSRNFLQFV